MATLVWIGACIRENEENAGNLYKVLTKTNFSLTDEMIVRYIAAYRQLREKGKTFAEYANGNKDSGLEGFALFEQIIKENGFKNYEEFVRVNAKIAWAFILLQGEQGIENFAYWKDSLKNEGEKMYQQSFSELDNAINDPSTPEETKQQLKETKAQLKEQRTKSYRHIEQRWENDKKWASWVIEKLKYITSEDDLKIVKKYQKHLQEVYTDIKLPSLML